MGSSMLLDDSIFVILSLSKYPFFINRSFGIRCASRLGMTGFAIDRLVMLTKEASFHHEIPRYPGMTVALG
jgi:hypothetical protein